MKRDENNLHVVWRERRADIIHRAEEIAENPNQTRETRAEFNRLMVEADEMTETIRSLEGRLGHHPISSNAPPNGAFEYSEQRTDNREREHRAAFSSFLRVGVANLGLEQRDLLFERRDLGTGGQGAYTGATSGFFVPVGFVQRIEEAMKFASDMLRGGPGDPTIFDTATGQNLPFPASDDTGNSAELIAENAQVASQDTTISQVMLGAFKYSSKLVKVSIELLNDSAFDIEAYLTRAFAWRFARKLTTDFTTGAGTTEPKGIVTSIGSGQMITAAGSATNDGGAVAANTIGSDDLYNLIHQVDVMYRTGAKFMLHDSTLKALRKVKDKYGRMLLFEPSRAEGVADTILGYPYLLNNGMDQLQTAASSPTVTRKTVVYGALDKYLIRRVKDMSVLRLTERFADFGQVAFLGFARYDGNSLDIGARALALLKNVY